MFQGIFYGFPLLAVCLGRYGSAAMSLPVKDFKSLLLHSSDGMVGIIGLDVLFLHCNVQRNMNTRRSYFAVDSRRN